MLLHHEATDGCPCPRDNGPVRSCWYIGRNDNVANDPAEWAAWIAAIKASGPRSGLLEAGAWTFDAPLVLDEPYGFQLLGYGVERSILGCNANGNALTVNNPGEFRMADIGIWTGGGNIAHGLEVTATTQGDAVEFERVTVTGGEFSAATVRFHNVAGLSLRRVRAFNYSQRNPSPTAEFDAVSGGDIHRCEFNSYVSGSSVAVLTDSTRLTFDSNTIFGANLKPLTPNADGSVRGADNPWPRQECYLLARGQLSLIAFRASLFQSDSGYAARNWLHQDDGRIAVLRADETSHAQTAEGLYPASPEYWSMDGVYFNGSVA